MTTSFDEVKKYVDFGKTEHRVRNWEAWERDLDGDRLSIKATANFVSGGMHESDVYEPEDAEIVESAINKWKHSYNSRGYKVKVKYRDRREEYKAISATKDCEFSQRNKESRKVRPPTHVNVNKGSLMFNAIRAYYRHDTAKETKASHLGISVETFEKLAVEAIECTHYQLYPQDWPLAAAITEEFNRNKAKSL